MIKKLVVTLSFASLCLFVGPLAAQAELTNYAKEGFYLGAGVGQSFNHYKFNTFGTTNGIDRLVTTDKTTVLGSLFAGYGGTLLNKFYIGAEVGTNFPSRKSNFTRLNASVTGTSFDHLSMIDHLTVDIIPGVRLTNEILVYLRMGTAYSHLTFKNDANPAAGTPLFSYTFNQLSTRLGLGVNYNFTNHFSVEANYIYMDYQVFTGYYSGFLAEFRDKNYTHYVGLALVYTIC